MVATFCFLSIETVRIVCKNTFTLRSRSRFTHQNRKNPCILDRSCAFLNVHHSNSFLSVLFIWWQGREKRWSQCSRIKKRPKNWILALYKTVIKEKFYSLFAEKSASWQFDSFIFFFILLDNKSNNRKTYLKSFYCLASFGIVAFLFCLQERWKECENSTKPLLHDLYFKIAQTNKNTDLAF